MSQLDRFNEIKDLYFSLSRMERDLLQAYLDALEKTNYKEYIKPALFFRNLSKDEDITQDRLLGAVELNKSPRLAINNFLLKIKDLIFETLIIDHNLTRPGEYRNRFRNYTFNEKKLMQAQILISRDRVEHAEKLLEEVISKGTKYELFEQVLSAQKLMKVVYFGRKSSRIFDRLKDQIVETRRTIAILDEAQSVFFDFRLALHRNESEDSLSEKEKALATLEKKHNFESIKFYRRVAESQLQLKHQEFKAAIKTLNTLEKYCISSPPVQSDKALSDVKSDLGMAYIELRQFDKARQAFTDGDKLVKNRTHESYIFKKNLLYLDLYEGKLEAANEELEKRLKSVHTQRLPYAMAHFSYLGAVHAYLSGDYRKSFKILSEEIKIEKNLSIDLLLGYHILTYLTCIEFTKELKTENSPIAGKLKDTLIQFDRLLEKYNLRRRDRVILRFLKRMEKFDFDFKKLEPVVQNSLQKLERNAPNLRWKPLTYEVFPIQNWFYHKLDKRKSLMKIAPAKPFKEK